MPEAKHTENAEKRNPRAVKNNLETQRQTNLPVETDGGISSELPVPTQARDLGDARLPVPLRQQIAQQIGRKTGNRTLQRLVNGNQQQALQREPLQRGPLDDFINWFRGLFSADPQEVIQNMDSGLEHAHSVVEAVAETTTDPTRRRRWEQLAERLDGLKRVTGGIVDVIEAAETIGHVEDFVEALNDIPDNISDDPDAAADAFGRLFASAGELGGLLPEGPWSPYFEWLSNSRDFFTNMRRALDPSQRWRRQFEEIDREGPYTNERGVR